MITETLARTQIQATEILRGLHECGIKVGAEQHGDSYQMQYVNGERKVYR